MVVRVVAMEELGDIEASDDLADALDQLGRALKEVDRVGEEIGFHWRDHAEIPGNRPDDFADRLRWWASKVQEWGRTQA